MFGDIKAFISSFIKKIKSKSFAKITPIIVAVCLVAILVPSMIAIWQVYFKEDEPLQSSNQILVVLYDADGQPISEAYADDSGLAASPLVDILYNLYTNKLPIAAAPEGAIEEPNYMVTISDSTLSATFFCYFTENYANSYIADLDDNLYTFEEKYHTRFLTLEYSDAAYSTATPPSLITKDGDTVTPKKVDWSYKKQNGSSKKIDNFDTASTVRSYNASGSIGLSFDIPPSSCSVEVYDTIGNEVYSGDLAGVASITAEVGARLKFSLSAEWENSEEVSSFGSLEYNFEMVCKTLAEFEISASEVSPGGYFVISAHDIESDAQPTYTTDRDHTDTTSIFNFSGITNLYAYLSYIDALKYIDSFTPVFFKDGDVLRAIVPIPYNTPLGNLYFTLSSGASTASFVISITANPEPKTIEIVKPAQEVESSISKKAIDEVTSIAKQFVSPSKHEIFARGEFLAPDAEIYSKEYSFGDSFVLDGEPLVKLSALGNAYLTDTPGGVGVYAANIGRVIEVGYSDHLGKFAVVDHGAGICTWYCNLSDICVSKGDAIAKGEMVGLSGESVMLEGNGVLILCSIYGSLVDPDIILGNEISYT